METITIYKYDELNESAKEAAFESYKDSLYQSYSYNDMINDTIREDIIQAIYALDLGMKDTEVCFSLCSCQGDGVSFTGEIIGKENLYKLAGYVYEDNIPNKIKHIIPFLYSVCFERDTGCRYYHAYSVDTKVIDNYNDWTHDRFLAACEQFQNDINDWRVSLCYQYEGAGYDTQDYYFSDEAIEEEINLQEPYFYESGELYA